MHIHELLPYHSYRYYQEGKPLLFRAVGWLEAPYTYKRGAVPVDFFNKIAEWCSNPDTYGVHFTRGFHQASIEKFEDSTSWYADQKFKKPTGGSSGNGELVIRHKGKYYATPMMIYQYIYEYGYHPPQEFIEAVLEGELIDSETLETYTQQGGEQLSEEEIAKNNRAKEHMDQCEKHLANEDLSAAEKEVRASLELKPNDVKALFFLARILFDKKQFKAAETTVNKALSQHPSIEATRALRGLILFHRGKLTEAEEDLLYLLPNMRKNPGNNLVQTLFYLGKIAQKKRDYTQAKVYYQEALVVEPGDPDIKRSLRYTKVMAFIHSFFGK